MGAGIAFTCALHGYQVIVYDLNEATLAIARETIHKYFDYQVAKSKLSAEDADQLFTRIQFSGNLAVCKAELVIEAIVEDLAIKQHLFQELRAVNPDAILASNTSSLSIEKLQENLKGCDQFIGIHFFNPPHIMKLVEVIFGKKTTQQTIEAAIGFCKSIGKTAVLCKDSPGFIVNRVARPYYLEAMRIATNYDVAPETIDAAMEGAGFKMGPFKLMDLIGMDVNLKVSTSVYEALGRPPRFKPNKWQVDKVADGELGMKSGKGFYQYREADS